MGDRVGFAQREPLVLQPNPMVSVFDRVVLSTLVGAHSPAIALIWRPLTDAPACGLLLHRWPHPPWQGVWKLYPENLLLQI